ncbi:rho GTPase-activating protein 15-like [Salarias fasciatus]|uniref:Rho GTPase-activating protein 15 n=1 Tax=Salarias fasciatus TaxID=181472 RepID=A0A672IDB3_SALFA|nr:rho GTPase-activating protein 15-like [Salarias fasciatus]XP_029967794.1 rho GTPase-activating protein 15-like [Salarias fasciatus]
MAASSPSDPQTGSLDPVKLRIKTPQSSTDRLSQSKSMVLQDSDLPQKPPWRHRRNQSQHNTVDAGAALLDPLLNLKGEQMNMAKISESGKKQRKNWTAMWAVLTADQLLFSKDKPEHGLKAGGRTDVVELSGALMEWTTEKSSRKNVFQITTSKGSQYLIQDDCQSTASRWFHAIKKAASSSTEDRSEFPLRRSNSTDLSPRHSSLPGYTSASPSAKPRIPAHRRSINMFGSAKLKHSTSDSSDKNRVKNRLKKFITRRPSMKTLQEKGFIKDRVFGCNLSTLCEREGTTVPKFVQTCIRAVEKRGLQADGIYRVSGNLATIQKLRFIVDQEEELDLDHSQWEDIHVITGALKMFFRELPEPLFPSRFFQRFVEAIKIQEPQQKVQAVKKLIEQMPKPNQDTMKVLFSHLHRVLAFSRRNLMSTQGVSIVFGPTLMWHEQDAANMAVNMAFQNQIVEFILIESHQIFDLKGK